MKIEIIANLSVRICLSVSTFQMHQKGFSHDIGYKLNMNLDYGTYRHWTILGIRPITPRSDQGFNVLGLNELKR